MSHTSPRRRGTGYYVILIAVIALASASLRAPFLAVAPVVRTIASDLETPIAVVGLLTSIPVLCFAVFAPAAVALVRRGGADFALTITLVGTIVGCLVRSAGGIGLALFGTALIGMFLTVGNVVVPILIGREFSAKRAHLLTGVYTSAINVGIMLATVTTAPLAAEIGWQAAVAVWGCFAVAALLCWLPLRGLRQAFTPQPGSRPSGADARGSAWRHAPTLLLAAAFAGQGFAFYGVSTWLPSMLADLGYSDATAGAIASLFQVLGIAGSLLVPLVTVRAGLTTAMVLVGIGWLFLPLGLLLAPDAVIVWCVISGVAQAGGITMVFITINALAPDEHTKAGRSGLVQATGYAVGALGPLAIGGLHDATGAWVLPLLAILAAVLVLFVCGVMATRMLRPDPVEARAA